MMKKILPIAVSALLIGLSGCASSGQSNTSNTSTSKLPSRPNQGTQTNHTSQVTQTNQGAVLNMSGSVKGFDVANYQFSGKKGQVLRIVRNNTSPKIQLSLSSLDVQGDPIMLSGDYQVLPYTGRYQLVVGQNRNDARDSSAPVAYNLSARLEDQKVSTAATGANVSVNYRCDDGKNLSVAYSGMQSARVSVGGIAETLRFDNQYSKPNNPVFSSKDYMLSVGTADSGNLQQSQVYSLNSFKRSQDGEIVVQDCQAL